MCTPAILVLSMRQAVGVSDHCIQIADLDVIVQQPTTDFHWMRPYHISIVGVILETVCQMPLGQLWKFMMILMICRVSFMRLTALVWISICH